MSENEIHEDHEPVRADATLAGRLADLKRTQQVLLAGLPTVPEAVINVTAHRLQAEIEMLLMCDDELVTLLQELAGQPAIAASISRPAAAKELARRAALSAHDRISEVRERMRSRHSDRAPGSRGAASLSRTRGPAAR